MKRITFIITLLAITFYSTNLSAQSSGENLKPDLTISKESKKNVLKVNLLSPLLEHLEISYERVLSTQGNLDLSVGRIGIWNFKHETQTIGNQMLGSKKVPVVKNGWFFRGGYKYFFNHPVSKKHGASTQFLNGLYLKPEMTIGFYEKNKFKSVLNENTGLKTINKIGLEKINYQALLLHLGWQRVLGKHFLIDFSYGIGIGNDNVPRWSSDYYLYVGEFHRGIYKTNGGTTLAMNGAIKLGYAF